MTPVGSGGDSARDEVLGRSLSRREPGTWRMQMPAIRQYRMDGAKGKTPVADSPIVADAIPVLFWLQP